MKFKIIANQQTPEAKALVELSPEKKKMLVKFLSFARRQHNCCGLAANQVSLDGERILERFFAIKVNKWWDVIINPEIIEYKGISSLEKEGCLTWLGRIIQAKRFNEISVRYCNLEGKIIERSITGFEAQIWQHEYNHLMGIEEEIL